MYDMGNNGKLTEDTRKKIKARRSYRGLRYGAVRYSWKRWAVFYWQNIYFNFRSSCSI